MCTSRCTNARTATTRTGDRSGTPDGSPPDSTTTRPWSARPLLDDLSTNRLLVPGDSAYRAAQARAALAQAGHTTITKSLKLRRTVPGGLSLDDFTVNEQAGTVTCPAGDLDIPLS